MVRASVAMAARNGERYIKDQIDSILTCMSPEDELVISCDPSTDSTVEIVNAYAASDSRIRVLINDIPGVQSNFNNAVTHCVGKYIFFADQDDIWIEEKIDKVISVFEKTGADMVMHDGYFTDENLNCLPGSIFKRYGTNNSFISNLIRCSYWGCCMAIRATFRKIVCPFPTADKVWHDIWISLMATRHGTIARCDDILVLHRRHADGQSTLKRRPIPEIIKHRVQIIKEIKRRERQRRLPRIRA